MPRWMAGALSAFLLSLSVPSAGFAGIPIEGRVLDERGEALAGAVVELLPVLPAAELKDLPLRRKLRPEPADRAISDTNGRFKLAAPEIGPWRVRIGARGFIPVETSLLPLLRHRVLEPVRLERDLSAQVQVLDAEGRPLPGALVWATSYAYGSRTLSIYRWYPAWRWADTGANGMATLPRGPTERLEVSVLAPGYPVMDADLPRERASVEVKPVPGCERRIEVRDPAGQPVAGAVLRSPLFFFPESPGWELGTTGQDGSLTARIPCNNLRLDVESSDGRRMKTFLTYLEPDQGLPLRIILPAAARWIGKALIAGTREPIAGALVWSARDAGEVTRSDALGNFVLPVPLWAAPDPPAAFQLSAAAPGYLPASLEVPAPDAMRAADGGLTLLLKPAARLEGVVVDAADRPVAEAEVSAQLASSFGDSSVWFREHWTRSDATGRFLLEVPPQDRAHPSYFVQSVRDGFAPSMIEIAALEPGAARSGLRLVLQVGQQASGRVLGPDSKPVAGAEVVLIPESSRSLARARLHRDPSFRPATWPSASSQPEGRFTFPHLAAGRFDLQVKVEGFAPFTRRGVSIPEGEGTTDLGTVVLDPGFAVEGLVVDSQDRPIAGATVEAQDFSAWDPGISSLRPSEEAVRTGPDGRFRLQNLERDRAIDLIVLHDGHTPVRVRQIALPAAEPLRVILQSAVQVSGRVVNDRGEPVAGAEASAFAAAQTSSYPGAVATARSGPDGAFQLDVEPGKVRLGAEAEGFLPSDFLSLDVIADHPTEGVVLQVRLGAIVEGRVMRPDGSPLADANVGQARHPAVHSPVPRSSSSTRTDGEGRYRLEGIAPGPGTFEVEHDSFARTAVELEVRPGTNHLDFQMRPGASIAGRVADTEGKPVEGARVMLSPGFKETMSGPDGGFRFSGVPPGTYSLSALKTGLANAQLEGIQVQDASVQNLELRFEKGSAIAGKILGLSAEQLSKLLIMALDSTGRGFASGKVDAGKGEYRVEGVTAGEWTIRVALPSGRLMRRTATVPLDGTDIVLDLDFGKAEGLILSGRIVRAGRSIAGAMVIVEGEDVEALGADTSAAEGTFRIESLTPGRYQLAVIRDAALQHSETVELSTSRDLLVTLSTATLSGQVVLPNGSPAAGAAVELRPTEGFGEASLRTRSAATDAAGAFVLGDTAPGSYRITADRDGYARAEASVEVPESGNVEGLQLRLSPAIGLVLELQGPGGSAPPSVATALLDEAGRTVAVSREVPGDTGRVHLRAAPAGRFFLLLSGPGFATVEVPVTIPSDALRIDLAPGRALRVTVPELVRQGKRGTLTIMQADGRPFRSITGWGEPTQQWRAIRSGNFYVEGLPAGPWKLRVTAPDGKIWEKEVMAAEGAGGGALVEAILEK